MIGREELAGLLRPFLPTQRWYGGADPPDTVTVRAVEVVCPPWPALVQVTAEVPSATGAGTDCYHVPLGVRPAGEPLPFLDGHPDALLGVVDTDAGKGQVYEALLDPELDVALLATVVPGTEEPQHVRFLAGEQSNTSVVFDDRLILKVFRRPVAGENPDVEVPLALAAVDFPHVARPVATWRRDDLDLAVVKEFLVGGSEGWSLALTSLRDLYAEHGNRPAEDARESATTEADPAAVGGDFAGEARRLGVTTGELHVALADAFGRQPGDAGRWADDMDAQLRRTPLPGDRRDALADLFARLRWVDDSGPAIRVHGDYHLGQTMRTDAGWYVLDFEGEPLRPLEERRRPTSPLKDVAGMLRSLDYASAVAEREREEPVPELARAWAARNRQAFLDGYLEVAAAAGLLPGDDETVALVLRAFELDKAVYEVAYEEAHRPEWASIPLAAIDRHLADAVRSP